MIKRFLLVLAAAAVGCSSGGNAPIPIPNPGPGGDTLALPHAATEFIVFLEDEDDADEIAEDFAFADVEQLGTAPIFIVRVPAGTDLAELRKELDEDLRILDSEPNYLASSPEGGPADVATLGSDTIDALSRQPALDALQIPAAHARSTGAGVVVAVLDTGIDFTHPFLAGRIAPNGFDFIGRDGDPSEERNFVDDDNDGAIDEQFGHGTFVASLVLAVAPDATVLPVRVLDADGFGTASSIAAGILWALDAGAQVINISVELPDASDVVKDAIEAAKDRGVVVVAAAGNEGAGTIVFPARFGDVLGVAATDNAGIVAPFTNAGDKVALVAPGVELIGAMPLELTSLGTARWSGTSFSAPLVAGCVALVRAASPRLEGERVVQNLRDTAQSVDAQNPAFAGRLGRGLPHPAAAIDAPR